MIRISNNNGFGIKHDGTVKTSPNQKDSDHHPAPNPAFTGLNPTHRTSRYPIIDGLGCQICLLALQTPGIKHPHGKGRRE